MGTFTDDDVERLRAAIAHGEQSVTIGDQTVTFRTVKELLDAYDRARTDQASAAGRPRITYRRLTGGF